MSDVTISLTDAHVRGPLISATKVDAFSLQLTDASLLRECPHLEVCALSDNNLDDSVFQALSSCTQLRELYLRRNRIRDVESLAHLAQFPRLTHLMLSENPVALDPLYRAECLRHCPSLQKLDQSDVDRATSGLRVSLHRGGPVRTQPHAAVATQPHATVAGLTLINNKVLATASRFVETRPATPGCVSARSENVLTAALLLINELDVQGLERVISRARAALAHRTALAARPPTASASTAISTRATLTAPQEKAAPPPSPQ